MIFIDALNALRAGRKIRRPGDRTLQVQESIVPILINPRNPNVTQWTLCMFVVSTDFTDGRPCAFSQEEVEANNWEIVP